MLDEPSERRVRQVEAVEVGVAALELGDNSQRVGIVVEAAVGGHAGVEGVLAGVAKRSMAKIVTKRDRLGQIVVEAKSASKRAGNLGDLDRVGEPGPEMVALVMDEDLRLVGETPERG